MKLKYRDKQLDDITRSSNIDRSYSKIWRWSSNIDRNNSRISRRSRLKERHKQHNKQQTKLKDRQEWFNIIYGWAEQNQIYRQKLLKYRQKRFEYRRKQLTNNQKKSNIFVDGSNSCRHQWFKDKQKKPMNTDKIESRISRSSNVDRSDPKKSKSSNIDESGLWPIEFFF